MVKKSDLSTRKRVNVVLDIGLYEAIKKYSAETHIPVSRLLDQAIEMLLQAKRPTK